MLTSRGFNGGTIGMDFIAILQFDLKPFIVEEHIWNIIENDLMCERDRKEMIGGLIIDATAADWERFGWRHILYRQFTPQQSIISTHFFDFGWSSRGGGQRCGDIAAGA